MYRSAPDRIRIALVRSFALSLTTRRAFEAHLTNDAHFVVDIEDAIVIEDVIGVVIARRRLISIH